MRSYDVTAVYESGLTIIVKHATLESALNTINVIKHNAKINCEKVKIVKGWLK